MRLSTRARKLIGDGIVAVCLLALFLWGGLWYFDFMVQDTLFQRPRGRQHPDIIVVGIDARTIEEFGNPLFWSRNIVADAIHILNSVEGAEPAVIAVDILYVGESADAAADANLAAAAEFGNLMVAKRAILGLVRDENGRVVQAPVGFELPFDALAENAFTGVVNAIHDDDQRIRVTRFTYEVDGEISYSFPYEIYRMYRRFWGEYEYLEAPPPEGEIYIIYRPPGAFKQLSFAEIFEEDFQPEFLADTLVMIGAFAPGLGDDFQVPVFAERMFGVEIHANILQGIMDGNPRRYAPQIFNFALFAATLLLALLLANFLKIRLLIASYATTLFVCLGVAALAFHFGLILSLIYVPVALSVVFVYQLIYSYVLESIARKKAQLIAEKHQILLDSINYASVIQTGLLPKPSIFSKAFADHSVIWNPRDTVGGDIYWIKKFENSGTLLAVADCTGHGVPGALLTALVVSSLEEIVNETSSQSPAEILFELDNKLARVFEAKGERTAKDAGEQENAPPIKIKNGCDIAVLFITEGDGAVRIASGNINVFICNGKEVSRVKGQRISIGEGKIKESAEIKETLISADKSNKFYIASDGLYDQIGGSHSHSFGYNAFKKLILDNHNEAQSIITERIWAAFENYRGDHIRLDDFELVAFRPFIEP